MGIRPALSIIFLIGVSTCAAETQCPNPEDIAPCHCSYSLLTCSDYYGATITLENLKAALSHFRGQRIRFSLKHAKLRIPSKLFDGILVEDIDISGGNITSLVDEEGGPAFVGLESSLKKFSITGNFLNEKILGTFGHLQNLRQINFFSNDIQLIDNNFFGKGESENLWLVVFEENNVVEFGDQVFAKLTNVEKINLFGNKIRTVQRSMFPNPASELGVLYLGGNHLTTLPVDLFENMPSLREVRLITNEIVELDERTWKPVWSQLDILDIRYNPLHCGSEIEWIFNIRSPKRLAAHCATPPERKGEYLENLIKEKEKGGKVIWAKPRPLR